MTPKERQWLTNYVEMMKANLAISPAVTWMGMENNTAVIDMILEVQAALNEDGKLTQSVAAPRAYFLSRWDTRHPVEVVKTRKQAEELMGRRACPPMIWIEADKSLFCPPHCDGILYVDGEFIARWDS